MSRTTPEPNLPVAEASADQIENGCRGMYGPTWDGPPEKMPGEKMKEVWRTYSKNCLNAALATPIPPLSAVERMREALERAERYAFAWKMTAKVLATDDRMVGGTSNAIADDLERLCCAETEGKFFDCVTDNIATIIHALRHHAATILVAQDASWRERWNGSDTERGWSIMSGRDLVAHIGGDESMSEAVGAIVAAHNALALQGPSGKTGDGGAA